MPLRVDEEQVGRSDASIKRKAHREVERHGGWLIRVAYPITRRLTRVVWPCLAGAKLSAQTGDL